MPSRIVLFAPAPSLADAEGAALGAPAADGTGGATAGFCGEQAKKAALKTKRAT
jgi:hypothetical protein